MKKISILLLGTVLIFSACNKNKGKISMTFSKGTAIYADIDEIRAVPLTATASSIDNPGKIFIGETFMLIGEEGKGIHVYDNTNPNAPINTSFIQVPYNKEFYVDGTTIYAESHYDFLKIDISDINSPVLVHRLENAFTEPELNENGEAIVGFIYKQTTETFKINSKEAQTLKNSYYLYYDYNNELIPESAVPSSFAGSSESINGTLNKIALANDYSYIIGSEKIHCFENSATSMSKSGSRYIQPDLETIYAEHERLYIGSQSSMIVLDASNPADPEQVSTYFHPTSCDPVFPFGDIAYLTLRTEEFSGCAGDENSLEILDISNINHPYQLNSITMESPYGMRMINNHLFVGEGENGLAVFDASNPEDLVLVKNYDFEAYDIMMHPTIPNRILTTSNNGLDQYNLDYNTMEITFLSRVNY